MVEPDAWTVERPGFTVRFLAGADDHPATVGNLDAHIEMADGRTRYATVMTTGEIDSILRRWRQTGEAGGGLWFWCSDLVIVPGPGVAAMVDAVQDLVTSGQIEATCSVQQTSSATHSTVGTPRQPK